MENRKPTNPGFEKLDEEELSAVSGGTDSGEPIRSLPLNNPDVAICTVCGKLKKIEYYYHAKRICGACLESAK